MKYFSFVSKQAFFLILFLFSVFFFFPKTSFAVGEFITTWKTDNSGTSLTNQITIPTLGGGYNYDVDWGDGTSDTGLTGDVTHTYGLAGTYTVQITGTFPRIYFNFGGDRSKLLSIEQWGNQVWSSMNNAFFGCDNMAINAIDAPDLSVATDMTYMLRNSAVTTEDLSGWNVSNIETMIGVFQSTSFNGDITTWDTSSVTNMTGLFYSNSSFNQPIGAWNTSAVTSMESVFSRARSFNQPIGTWNTSAVTNMVETFYGASGFNQALGAWDVSNVTNMSGMFRNSAFNQSLALWDVSSVTNITSMFQGSSFNQDISAWDTSLVTNMSYTFQGAIAFNQPLNTWNTSSVTNMYAMFAYASNFNQPLGGWNTSNVTNFGYMFEYAADFDQDISTWNTSSALDIAGIFSGASVFNQPIGVWDVSNVTSIYGAFNNASLFNQSLNAWSTGSATDMTYMFYGATAFNQPLSAWNTSSVTDMGYMFMNATSFNQDISAWDVSNVVNMENMFRAATSFDQLLNTWDTAQVTNISGMFYGATSFNQALAVWNVSNVTNMSSLFEGASAFDQPLNSWNISNVANISNMFTGVTLSSVNYDLLLVAWALLPLQLNLVFDGGNSMYCSADTERTSIITTYNWTITDGGDSCTPVVNSGGSGGGGKRMSTNKNNMVNGVTLGEIQEKQEIIAESRFPFTDLKNHFSKQYVQSLWEKKVVQGRTITQFEPESFLTRAEILKIAFLLFNTELTTTSSHFSDVSHDDWYSPYVATAKANAIIQGFPDGKFLPNMSVTRAEALKILLLVSGKTIHNTEINTVFEDVLGNDWFSPFVVFANERGIVQGKTSNMFAPNDLVTRGEMAKMAYKIFELQ